MPDLKSKTCIPCQGGTPTLTSDQIAPLLSQLSGWEVIEVHHLRKEFSFPDFVSALDHVNRIGALAEEEGHHPDIQLAWGRVVVEIFTHKVGGLTESDFILAAKIDDLPMQS